MKKLDAGRSPVSPNTSRTRRLATRTRTTSQGSRPKLDLPVRDWHRAFHQLHTEADTYTPVALRLLPTDIGSRNGLTSDSRNESPGPSGTGRCVYEVAMRSDAQAMRWVLICWEVDVPGIQFCDCANREEAIALFAKPSKAAGRWHGVRLGPAHRGW